MGLIKQLLQKWSCNHIWEQHCLNKVYKYPSDSVPTAVHETLICTKCGKIKKIVL